MYHRSLMRLQDESVTGKLSSPGLAVGRLARGVVTLRARARPADVARVYRTRVRSAWGRFPFIIGAVSTVVLALPRSTAGHVIRSATR